MTIDEYTYDKKKAPQQLQDLVTGGYLRGADGSNYGQRPMRLPSWKTR